MTKYKVYETEHVVREYIVEAESKSDALIIYELEGVTVREKTLSSELDVEEY